MRHYTQAELPEGYEAHEQTGFIRILTSQPASQNEGAPGSLSSALFKLRHYSDSLLYSRCPFVGGISKREGYYVYPTFKRADEVHFLSAIKKARDAFLYLAGEGMANPGKTKFLSTMVSFHHPGDLTQQAYELMKEVKKRLHEDILRDGLMVSEMHPHHPASMPGRSENSFFQSEIPLYTIRAMDRADRNLLDTDEKLEIYESFFGKRS